jgi:hypothetical protein
MTDFDPEAPLNRIKGGPRLDVQKFVCGRCPWLPPSPSCDYSEPPPLPHFIGTSQQAISMGWRSDPKDEFRLLCPQCSKEMKLL